MVEFIFKIKLSLLQRFTGNKKQKNTKKASLEPQPSFELKRIKLKKIDFGVVRPQGLFKSKLTNFFLNLFGFRNLSRFSNQKRDQMIEAGSKTIRWNANKKNNSCYLESCFLLSRVINRWPVMTKRNKRLLYFVPKSL